MPQPDTKEPGAKVRFPRRWCSSPGCSWAWRCITWCCRPTSRACGRSAPGQVFCCRFRGPGPLIWARVHFFRTDQNPMPWTPSPELIFRGPYRFTRNPMYVGVTLFQIGLSVWREQL